MEDSICGLMWDPLSKYFLALLLNNQLIVFKCQNWDIFKKVSLNLSPKYSSLSCKRQRRSLTWSPDYNFLIVPSLDDSIVPLACAIDRQNFEIKQCFFGHFSTINYVAFNSNIYLIDGKIASVFAMGDAVGNISI